MKAFKVSAEVSITPAMYKEALEASLDAAIAAGAARACYEWFLSALEAGEEPGTILELLAEHPLGRASGLDLRHLRCTKFLLTAPLEGAE